jgi:hypothetical protein
VRFGAPGGIEPPAHRFEVSDAPLNAPDSLSNLSLSRKTHSVCPRGLAPLLRRAPVAHPSLSADPPTIGILLSHRTSLIAPYKSERRVRPIVRARRDDVKRFRGGFSHFLSHLPRNGSRNTKHWEFHVDLPAKHRGPRWRKKPDHSCVENLAQGVSDSLRIHGTPTVRSAHLIAAALVTKAP